MLRQWNIVCKILKYIYWFIIIIIIIIIIITINLFCVDEYKNLQ